MAPPSNKGQNGGGKSNVVFGQTMSKGNNSRKGRRSSRGSTRYQRQFGGGRRYLPSLDGGGDDDGNKEQAAAKAAARRRARQLAGEEVDAKLGLKKFVATPGSTETKERRGWLYNLMSTTVTVSNDASTAASGGPERSGLDMYFLDDSGGTFKSTVLYRPFFYVVPDLQQQQQQQQLNGGGDSEQVEMQLETIRGHLMRLYEDQGLCECVSVYRKDLDQPNHLSPTNIQGRPILKLVFDNTLQLRDVRDQVKQLIEKNKERTAANTMKFFDLHNQENQNESWSDNPLECLVEMREYDVPYDVRVCTDLVIRAGTWYTVKVFNEDVGIDSGNDQADNGDDAAAASELERIWATRAGGGVRLTDPDRESKANPTFLAFDIECTKAPLKFPSAEAGDEIFMISYMVTTPTGVQGYLICSRSVVTEDVHDFEYTPKPKYPGPFIIFNEVNEKALIERFFSEYQRLRPQIVVTYNGDFFDWPFVEARANMLGLDMFRATGVQCFNEEYRGRACVHLDAFHWVRRDSYLPQGSQGLKAVTKAKLGYDPVEVDPEDMVKFAQERPVHMATYSVSDAVATYYLYEKYVHLFIFSLSTVIPMNPEDVLRKGSGTLCEALLMVEACTKHIVCPNKQVDPAAKFYSGHLLESETYIGGKVECLETGVYRSDIEYDFDLKPTAFQQLIDCIDRDLCFAIEIEAGKDRKDILNYDEIKSEIVEQLEMLRDRPVRKETPYIYHLDVGAMYPNIILTNRLQPSSIVDDRTCASCQYNQARNGCKRDLNWIWRGDYNPATRQEYDRCKDQLSKEPTETGLPFSTLPKREQEDLVKKRLKTYAQKAYGKSKVTKEEGRRDVVCMRENDFYVDAVRQFRDRRYEYKKANKTWKKRAGQAVDAATRKECEDKMLVYDSLQVAHKCILNSFYGYVMRKGARWRSMEMAGIVTKTGADIITQARVLVEQIGRPLELDTDGIWCILPGSFPDVYTFQHSDGSTIKLEYPCVMLNADVHDHFTNHQYQTLLDPVKGTYETRSECSIFFEVDGPYRAMILPASTEEGKLLKKRYAVFNFDGSLAELKGFELKRRGELEIIKTFQHQVFEHFLDGNSLEACYDSVADIANHWMDVLDTRGESLDDDELFALISENKSMSRQLADYGDQKGTSQTTARRLGEFLGAEIIKDKGVQCNFIIAEQPFGAPVTERAIPTAIWKAELAVSKHYLRKWLKSPGLDGAAMDIRNILDWDYYTDRLSKTIQKIITIPAALQDIPNPVPRVEHPSWLRSKVEAKQDRFQQRSIKDMFGVVKKKNPEEAPDMEDMLSSVQTPKRPVVHRMKRRVTPEDLDKDNDGDLPKEREELSKENFGKWLAQKKASWRKDRRQRRYEGAIGNRSGLSSSFGGKLEKRAKNFSSMEGYVREAALSLTHHEWQVIEVREMTSYDATATSRQSSGEFTAWVMVGKDSLQKVNITVPRTIYISTRQEVRRRNDDKRGGYILDFRKVDRHLPHAKNANYLYEIVMPEYSYKNNKWIDCLQSVDSNSQICFETMYESGTPLIARVLAELGSVSRLGKSALTDGKAKKSYSLQDLNFVERPSQGEYLHSELSYKRLYYYVRIHPKTKTGIVAIFILNDGGGSSTTDVTRPSLTKNAFDVGASCYIFVVKPGGQRNINLKNCENSFQHLLKALQEQSANLEDSDYSCVSPSSTVAVKSLNFFDSEHLAYASANEVLSSYSKAGNGPTFLLLNSSRPAQYLRRYMSTFSSFPVLTMPFPPGPAHNPNLSSTLPSLNWERPSVQLCLEAYLYTLVISFPKRVSYSRYGNVPLGNLGEDENSVLYDVGLSRLIHKNRAVSWASPVSGRPDVGISFLPCAEGKMFPSSDSSAVALYNQDEIWGNEEELVSPVIRRPGCYRSICVDIDVQDLAIAALTDASQQLVSASSAAPEGRSPTNVMMFDSSGGTKAAAPLGDEMSTSISLPIARALISGWLRDAYSSNSLVADELLHHIYRFFSNPDQLLHDPALHRVVHSLMKKTFLCLLSELQRLGCDIVYASFHRVTVATNKIELADAEEYVNFVISTVRNRANMDQGDSLAKVSLRPRLFHSHFVFLDEYNFGTMHLERIKKDELEDDDDFVITEHGEESTTVVVPSVVTAWSIMNYLGSEIAQEYFRAIIGRFSRDVLKKQMDLIAKHNEAQIGMRGNSKQLLQYKKLMVSKHFPSYLTRAVGEILKDDARDEVAMPFFRHSSRKRSPALEFIKNVIVVLELDKEVENEVHVLKRSLLAQVGIAEYAQAAHWENPCPTFVLPDMFCSECHESKDVNLCYVRPRDTDEQEFEKQWTCEDCGAAYDVGTIEHRLIKQLNRKMVRYQLQDVRCTKTNRVAVRTLAPLSECSARLKLDIEQKSATAELRLLQSLADFYELETLKEITVGYLGSFN